MPIWLNSLDWDGRNVIFHYQILPIKNSRAFFFMICSAWSDWCSNPRTRTLRHGMADILHLGLLCCRTCLLNCGVYHTCLAWVQYVPVTSIPTATNKIMPTHWKLFHSLRFLCFVLFLRWLRHKPEDWFPEWLSGGEEHITVVLSSIMANHWSLQWLEQEYFLL